MTSYRNLRAVSASAAAWLFATVGCVVSTGTAHARSPKKPRVVFETVLPGQPYSPYLYAGGRGAQRLAKVPRPNRRGYPSGRYGPKQPYGYPGQPVPGSGSPKTAPARRIPAAVNLASEVQALRVRHPAVAAKLPADLRRLDSQAQPTLEKLPHAAQFSYYTTVEDYATLSVDDQNRLRDVLQGVAALPEADRTRFIQQESQAFGTADGDEARLKQIRSRPHDPLFQMKGDLERLKAAPVSAPASG
jgi:hypothetical protein